MDEKQEFTKGQRVTWVGTAGLFRRPVTIRAARRGYLAILGESPADARLVYDIHDATVIKGVVYSIPASQLRP
jgi:hypothetical protein